MPRKLWGEEWWSGGFYELVLAFSAEDKSLATAMQVLWELPELDGCYADRSLPLHRQQRLPPDIPDTLGWLYGTANVPNAALIPCGTFTMRDINETDDASGPLWLRLCLPMSALGHLDSRIGGYPFGSGTGRAWREPLDQWLSGVAIRIHAQAPFLAGAVGFEVSSEDFWAAGDRAHPDFAMLRPDGDQVRYFPSTYQR
ncbi:MAG: hypothetical protein AB7E79_12260 [Rhodospirillaceae bacterium]